MKEICIAIDHSKEKNLVPLYRQFPGKHPLESYTINDFDFVITDKSGISRGDWLVCVDQKKIKTEIPKNKRIFIQVETIDFALPSLEFLNNFQYIVTPFTIPNYNGIQIQTVTTGLFWWYGIKMNGHIPSENEFLTCNEIQNEQIANKTELLSTIVSSKNFLPGHKKRLLFTSKLMEEKDIGMHVYGYGFNEIADKRDALVPYKYHLAIENGVHPHYWTEKLADPILGKCVVFYHGAQKVNEYFSKETVIPIDINDVEQSINVIKETIGKNNINDEILNHNKSVLISKYNFPTFCEKLINDIERGAYDK